jgi:hypothetical protein
MRMHQRPRLPVHWYHDEDERSDVAACQRILWPERIGKSFCPARLSFDHFGVVNWPILAFLPTSLTTSSSSQPSLLPLFSRITDKVAWAVK